MFSVNFLVEHMFSPFLFLLIFGRTYDLKVVTALLTSDLQIFRILGTPNETIWPGFSKLPGVKVNFVKHQ